MNARVQKNEICPTWEIDIWSLRLQDLLPLLCEVVTDRSGVGLQGVCEAVKKCSCSLFQLQLFNYSYPPKSHQGKQEIPFENQERVKNNPVGPFNPFSFFFFCVVCLCKEKSQMWATFKAILDTQLT